MQKMGLTLNLVGTILFGLGAINNSSPTWADLANASKKSKIIYMLACFGIILIVVGYILQICAA